MKQRLLNYTTKTGLRILGYARYEKSLRSLCRNDFARTRLGAGALAYAYLKQLNGRTLRTANVRDYRINVNIAEATGANAYFFGQSGTLWLTERILRAGDAFVDIGANAGLYTLLAASVVGARGKVFAFEPHPANYQLLLESVATNGYAAIVKFDARALWDETGARLRFYPSNEFTNSGTASLIFHGVYQTPEEFFEVETARFDDVFADPSQTRFRLVKIDVERAEQQVLQGMSEHLNCAAIDYLLIELTVPSPAHDLLTRHGYRGFLLNEGTRKIVCPAEDCAQTFGDFLYVSLQAATTDDFARELPSRV